MSKKGAPLLPDIRCEVCQMPLQRTVYQHRKKYHDHCAVLKRRQYGRDYFQRQDVKDQRNKRNREKNRQQRSRKKIETVSTERQVKMLSAQVQMLSERIYRLEERFPEEEMEQVEALERRRGLHEVLKAGDS